MTTKLVRFPDGKPKALTFSYDDGVDADIRLVDIFKKHNLFGTFNVNSGCFNNGGNRLTAEQVKDLYIPAGQELACHAVHHPFLEKLPDAVALSEVLDDRRALEELSGGIIQGMAYPYGTYNARTIELLKAAGIKYSRTVISTVDFRLPDNWHALTATCHHKNPKLFELADKFINETPTATQHGWLFYVWGHTYEFDNDNNWDRIEQFAEKIAGKDDVWYATNMQIYDYLTAFDALQFSVDGTKVYNPTVTDVWFSADGKDCHVPAGKTVKIL